LELPSIEFEKEASKELTVKRLKRAARTNGRSTTENPKHCCLAGKSQPNLETFGGNFCRNRARDYALAKLRRADLDGVQGRHPEICGDHLGFNKRAISGRVKGKLIYLKNPPKIADGAEPGDEGGLGRGGGTLQGRF
jgi:hypothetical protein